MYIRETETMNKVYERMAGLMIEAKKESSTATLHSNYEDLMAYMKHHHPDVPYPPGPENTGAEEGVKIAGSIPHSEFVGYRAKKGKKK